MTAFRLKDNKVAPLIDLELQRLNFMRSNSVSPDKDELYLNGLKSLYGEYQDHEGSAEIQYYIALYYSTSGDTYTVDMPETRWHKKKALTICNFTMKQYPDSYGADLCKELATNIEQKSLTSQNEVAYAKGENGRMRIDYKNIDSAYLRIIRVPKDFYTSNSDYNRYWKYRNHLVL